MAQQQIITKPYVEELQDNDSLFINHDGALRQIKKNKTGFATKEDLEGKVDKETGKGLSTNDYTNVEKSKLADLENYDDAEVRGLITGLQTSKVDKTDLTKTDRRLNALYELTQGQAWDFDRDNNNAYSVDVPSGSKYASVGMVGGKSIVWNQCWGRSVSKEAGITYTKENGVYHIVKSTTANSGLQSAYGIKPNGHKYYISFFGKSENGNVDLCLSLGLSITLTLTNTMQKKSGIVNAFSSGNTRPNIYYYSPSGVECEYDCTDPIVVDLTAMFGAGNEPTVEEFEAMFPEDYYEYCEPTIISSQTDRVDVRGKNLFNPVDKKSFGTKLEVIGNAVRITAEIDSTGTGTHLPVPTRISVEAGKTVIVSIGEIIKSKETLNAMVYVSVNDENGNKLGNFNGNKAYQLPTNAKSIDVFLYADAGSGTAKIGDYIEYRNVQVEYGSTATEYSPYSLKQIPINFPILNSAGSVYDYIDINNGKLHQRVGVVDLGTLDWSIVPSGSIHAPYFRASFSGVKYVGLPYNVAANILIAGYTTSARTQGVFNDKCVCMDGDSIAYSEVQIKDSAYTDATAFKAAMSGVMLYYELAEEVITDITIPAELTDWLTVEAGGSITFHNVDEGKRLLIPSTEEYLVKLSEVISNG